MTLIKVLFLSANPKDSNFNSLKLDTEVRQVEESFLRSRYRDRFQLTTKHATRPVDLQRAILDHRPQIVHFAGHGMGEGGLVLENNLGKAQLVSTTALAELFSIFETGEIECILLNACYSEEQAIAIHQFVDCVIGMNQPIGDKAAIRFAEAFYDALGSGSSYEEAYKFGCNAIALEGSDEYSTPVLKLRKRRSVPHLDDQQVTHPPVTNPPAATVDPPRPSQSQSFGNLSFSGNSNSFNAIQSGGNVTFHQSSTHSTVTNADVQAALEALGNLKQAIATTNELDETSKEMVAIPIKKVEAELQKSKPDRIIVDGAIATMMKILNGVVTLAEPVTAVATLLAKAWVGLV